MTKLLPLTVSFFAFLATAGIAAADGAISVTEPWSRPLPAVSTNGAAYLILRNRGDTMDRLLSVASPIADRAELHTHLHEDGLVKMRPVEHIEVPAARSVALEPGGLHVMLFGLKKPFNGGLTYPMTLTFEHAGSVEVTVTVQQPDAGKMTPSAKMGASHKSGNHSMPAADKRMHSMPDHSKMKGN